MRDPQTIVRAIVDEATAGLRQHVLQLERIVALGPEAAIMGRRWTIDGRTYRVVEPRLVYCDIQMSITAANSATNPAQTPFRAPSHLVTQRITVSTADTAGLRCARLSWKRDNGNMEDFRSATANGTPIRPPLDALFTTALSDRPIADVERVFRKDRTMLFEGEPLDGTPPIDLDIVLAYYELVEV